MYVFGGWENNRNILNDVFEFDFGMYLPSVVPASYRFYRSKHMERAESERHASQSSVDTHSGCSEWMHVCVWWVGRSQLPE